MEGSSGAISAEIQRHAEQQLRAQELKDFGKVKYDPQYESMLFWYKVLVENSSTFSARSRAWRRT